MFLTDATDKSVVPLEVKKGIELHGDSARAAIRDELAQMIKNGVFRPVHHHQLSEEQRKKILRSIMFLKLKRDGRLKARLVADGRLQAVFGTESEVSSPTASAESVFVTLTIDAAEDREVALADIEGAYLEAYMDEEVLMEVDADLADEIIKMMPQWSSFLRSNNKLTTLLVKALYGCIQSARRFYELFGEGAVLNGIQQ